MATATVLTLNVAAVLPAATVTDAGTVAALSLLDSVTTIPPVGAALERVTVPVDGDPPRTAAGLTLTEVRVSGSIVSFAEAVLSSNIPVIVAAVAFDTWAVLIVNVAAERPVGIMTCAGGSALGMFDDTAIDAPPTGVGPLSVTVPVAEAPPVTSVGRTARLTRMGGRIVSVVVTDVFPEVAVIVTAVRLATARVTILNVAEVVSSVIMTRFGTIA